jgi:4-amino-4-deoxy-L-arabinose transferase-like glycosyltransferase
MKIEEFWNKVKKHKWHLHVLTLPINIIVCYLVDNFGFMHLNEGGKFWQYFLQMFITAWVCFGIEAYQGLLGANKTKEEKKDMIGDMLVGISAAAVGILIFEIFT